MTGAIRFALRFVLLAALPAACFGLVDACAGIFVGVTTSRAAAAALVIRATLSYGGSAVAVAFLARRLAPDRFRGDGGVLSASAGWVATLCLWSLLDPTLPQDWLLFAAALPAGAYAGWAARRIAGRIAALRSPVTWLAIYGVILAGAAVGFDLRLRSTLSASAVIGLGAVLATSALALRGRRLATPALALIIAGIFSATFVRAAMWWRPISTGRPASVATPNVVIVTADTLRGDRLGFAGYEPSITPRLDALAAAGVTFENAFAATPRTGPSHGSLLTGLYPPEHGALANGVPLRPDVPSVVRAAGTAGWHTAAFVSAFPLQDGASGLARHFHYYDDDLSGVRGLSQDSTYLRIYRPLERLIGSAPSPLYRLERPSDETTTRALRWVRGHAREAFLVWVHLYAPHTPYTPPAEWARRHGESEGATLDWGALGPDERERLVSDPIQVARANALYDAEISFVDAQVGRLIDGLREAGVLDRTLIVFTGDHGESLGEHELWFCHDDLHDGDLRIPLVLALPGGVDAGRRVQEPVALVDLVPTLEARLGLPPSVAAGRDLLASPSEDRTLYGYLWPEAVPGHPVQVSVRKGRWKLIAHSAGWHDSFHLAPRIELFDLAGDPAELRNVAAQHPDVVAALWEERPAWDPASSRSPGIDPETRKGLEALGYLR